VNPIRGFRKENEMEMKSRIVQLCIDASTWSMVAIFRLGGIPVKGEIIRIVIGIRRESRRNFKDQEQIALYDWCTC